MFLGDTYVTRDGRSVLLDGVSSYYESNLTGRETVIFTGLVDDLILGSWNADGELLSNLLFGTEEEHELDIVKCTTERGNGLYYFEVKKVIKK
jgi:hypothetical protein